MNALKKPLLAVFLSCLSLALLSGCQSAYFGALERVGIEKRKILSDRVERAKGQQDDAQEAYVDALEQFRAVVDFDGGDLERTYRRLQNAHEGAQSEADALTERLEAIESVATALFSEWEDELDEFQDRGLRERSAAELRTTRGRYEALMRAMRRAEASFVPALAALNDRVLFLKHNLNAAAIGSLRVELPQIEARADRLARDVREATAEADAFLAAMRND